MADSILEETIIKITKEQAKRFLLSYQKLLPSRQLKDKDGIVEYFKQVKTIQYDPLNKVGRNPDLVLQSRIKGYKPYMLEELLYKDRILINGWDKNRSIYLTEDWPYFKRYRNDFYNHHKNNEHINEIIHQIRHHISEKGPLSSIDLNFDKKIDWSWSPTRVARAALESMYESGELIIIDRVGTRKIYDFSKNHIHEDILNATEPNKKERDFIKWLVFRRISSIGLLWNRSGDAWLGFKKIKKVERTLAIKELINEDKITEINVEGIKIPFYIRSDKISLFKNLKNNKMQFNSTNFIAPLDNLMWDRKMIKELFDFDYVWEVYKPIKERKFGYYVLPVLHNDEFIARFEPEFDRKKKELIIKKWWWEPEINGKNYIYSVKESVSDFMKYLDAKSLTGFEEILH
ncbi:MAG: winged helix-turn-helix domain-containing protein [Kosmotoga sp.]|nr:MAG: winged helix-turn-helix domain-containing protein [Kosmotoga sp.]